MQPNEIVSFDNPEFGQVRAVEVDGKPIFCAKDIAKALDYSDTKNAIKLHCKGVAFYHPPCNRRWDAENALHHRA